MIDRATLATQFLSGTDWANVPRGPLAGDASNRKYERLTRLTGETAVLMDAPPDKGENTRPFLRIARHLSALGLSAPRVLAEDTGNGFLLLEDLGDALFARVVSTDPGLEHTLYTAATDVLVALHQHPAPQDLAAYDANRMTDMAALAWRWYLQGAAQEDIKSEKRFRDAFQPLLETHAPETDVLIQRDYHAENLLWLPARSGIARVGLLDFQDAMAGHRAYDLVSLLQDARRDVPRDVQLKMIKHYISATGVDVTAFEAAYHVLGAQRNLRILGVFARLSMHAGKPHYVDLIPRVWGHLMTDIAHPALAPVATIIKDSLPVPTETVLQRLKDKCGTFPTP